MAEYSSILLENAVESLAKLPGIGKKTALRLALHLLDEDTLETEQLADSLLKMKHNIQLCERCYNISDTKVCSICSNPRRDENILCVVADMRDVLAIERTASYNGLYHVLGGVISPIEGISPNDLKIAQLVQRSQKEDIKEIILYTDDEVALSPLGHHCHKHSQLGTQLVHSPVCLQTDVTLFDSHASHQTGHSTITCTGINFRYFHIFLG